MRSTKSGRSAVSMIIQSAVSTDCLQLLQVKLKGPAYECDVDSSCNLVFIGVY
jgi:hypothetical protein